MKKRIIAASLIAASLAMFGCASATQEDAPNEQTAQEQQASGDKSGLIEIANELSGMTPDPSDPKSTATYQAVSEIVSEAIAKPDASQSEIDATVETCREYIGTIVQAPAQQKTEPANAGQTASQRNACRAAANYLAVMPFSHSGLVGQLEYEGYSSDDATYAADNCGADWFVQAEKAATNYVDLMPFSRQGLIDQLIYEGYTEEQAVHGVDHVGL